MPIETIKSWQIRCDHCTRSLDVVAGKHWSHWIMETIRTRGQLVDHLRADRWTVGKAVLCSDCAVRP